MKNAFSITIRAPGKAELASLPKIESLADAVYSNDRFPKNLGVCSIEELEASLELGLLYIAELEGEIIGFAMCRVLGDYIHLQQLSVTPDKGRQGVGTLLLKQTIEMVSLKQYTGITLTTFSDVRWNAPFYRKCGFVDVIDYANYAELQQVFESEKSMGLKNRVGMIYKLRAT